jgi:hypothetical protein
LGSDVVRTIWFVEETVAETMSAGPEVRVKLVFEESRETTSRSRTPTASAALAADGATSVAATTATRAMAARQRSMA